MITRLYRLVPTDSNTKFVLLDIHKWFSYLAATVADYIQ